jgi:DNA-binding transcriptional MocR family regulator
MGETIVIHSSSVKYDELDMTIWSPRLPDTDQPIYRRIADALERDVRAGMLVGGSQLPTHRDLARLLDITPVTVTRAYAEAARRGLVESSTGRGTFVRATRRDPAMPSEIDLATNTVIVPLPYPSAHVLNRAADSLISASYATGPGSERHRAAGAMWIGRRTDPSRVLVTAGTQHALLLAFAATARTGETILCESVTYHGARAAASLLGIRLQGLPMDRHGLLPDALDRATRGRSPRVLYTIPSLQNPTGSVIPEKRRREIAAIAGTNGVTIIEDDVCGFLLEQTPPAIAAFAPERTIFITGLGKAVAPGLRVGYLTGSEELVSRAQSVLAASILFASPLLAEIAATWIEDGTVARVTAQKRAEVAMRNAAVRRILGKRIGSSDPRSSHLWVEVPKPWNPDAYAEEARRRRVRVASASSFSVSEDVPRAVRLSIGAPASMAELENALHVLEGIGERRAQEPVV